MFFLNNFFGDANKKYLKKIQSQIDKINSLEPKFRDFSNERLRQETNEFKQRLKKGETLDSILPEAFALVREASKRCLNQRHFDVQLIGGIVLHQGKIAEMKTGEGKTLASTLAVYLNALSEKGVHVVTVNDYLAKRDTVWMGQIYCLLGLSVGCILHNTAYVYKSENSIFQNSDKLEAAAKEKDKKRDILGGFKVIESYLQPATRKQAYSADITYGTNNEFGFDYLRDNMIYDLKEKVQRGFNFAIIDEVDSILIDEARTPLIISAPDNEAGKMYNQFAKIVPILQEQIDYKVDEKLKTASLTEKGIDKIEKQLGIENIYEEKGISYLHHLEQALRAQALFKKDKDYMVKHGEVIIVDEFTGRLLQGRRFSGGLHQALEAKEGVKVQPESKTLASVTFQNYFRLYKKLAGMTGTAITSAEEFDKVYKLEVIVIPSNKPIIRNDLPDKIYKTEQGKFKAVVREIKQRYLKGQPVLVGTTSIEKNEYLGKLLDIEGIPHQILNAKHHEKEGEIIAQAGRLKQVTIATNMAGRGVDIVLGGCKLDNQETQKRTGFENTNKEIYGQKEQENEQNKVKKLGGLHIIGTERHEARRIDNQLRGRSGRQGDPGSSQFFVSLEDDLLRIFGGDRIQKIMEMLKIPEDQAIEAKIVSGVIENAQTKIEGMNFDLRKYLLGYDDVLNKHREVIYKKRKEILVKIQNTECKNENDLRAWIIDLAKKHGYSYQDYEKKEKEINKEKMRKIEKVIALRTLDLLWIEHLENMEHLRDSVRLRAYGQQDPLIEYKNEGHKLFRRLLSTLETNIVNAIFKVKIIEPPVVSAAKQVFSEPSNSGLSGYKTSKKKSEYQGFDNSVVRQGKKIGRNDPCPCGKINPDTGKPVKYKKCCYPKYG